MRTLFYGWSESDLLAALRAAQEDYARGRVIVGAGAGDVSSTSVAERSALQRITALQRALYEFDPVTYAQFATVGRNQVIAAFA